MNKSEIYYFSATGNSLAVAKEVAKKIDAKMVPLNRVDYSKERIHIEADCIGIISPIYDSKPVKYVEEFVKKLDGIDKKYIFAVYTHGVTVSNALKKLELLINSYNGNLSGGFEVALPHNGAGSRLFSEREKNKKLSKWKDKTEYISKYVLNKETGTVENGKSIVIKLLQTGIIIKMVPLLTKMLFYAIKDGMKSLSFVANSDCVNCKTCEKICPTNNITIKNNKPAWGDNCLSCFACINWCPKKAIQLGRADLYLRHYHHPDIKVSELYNNKT